MQQTTTQPTPDDRSMGFEPVQGGGDTTSAAALLVAAYLIMWALLLGFVLLSWRRAARVEGRLVALERALEATRGAEK